MTKALLSDTGRRRIELLLRVVECDVRAGRQALRERSTRLSEVEERINQGKKKIILLARLSSQRIVDTAEVYNNLATWKDRFVRGIEFSTTCYQLKLRDELEVGRLIEQGGELAEAVSESCAALHLLDQKRQKLEGNKRRDRSLRSALKEALAMSEVEENYAYQRRRQEQ